MKKWEKYIDDDEMEQRQFDFVESKQMQAIQDGDINAIIYWLSTKGKKYGYGSTSEVINNTIADDENGRPIISFVD